jgi:hypothetical protein
MAGSKPAALPLGDAPVSDAADAAQTIPIWRQLGCCLGMRGTLTTFFSPGNPLMQKKML